MSNESKSFIEFEKGSILLGDCLSLMKVNIKDESIDMIFCNLP